MLSIVLSVGPIADWILESCSESVMHGASLRSRTDYLPLVLLFIKTVRGSWTAA